MGPTSHWHDFRDPQITEEFEIRLVQSAILAFAWERQENQHHVLSAYIIPCNPGLIQRAMATTAGCNLKFPCDSFHSWALQLSVQRKGESRPQTLPQNSWLVNNEMLGWTAIVIFGDFLCPATTSVLLSREDPLR